MNLLSSVSSALETAKDTIDQNRGTELEKKVKLATSLENWGATTTLKNEIAQATFDYLRYKEVMPTLWKRMLDNPTNWRINYKALQLLDHLIRAGSDKVIQEARERMSMLRQLQNFQSVDADGTEKGSGVRSLSKQLEELLNNDKQLKELRHEFARNKNKYTAASSEGFASSTYAGFSAGYDRTEGESAFSIQADPDKKKKKKKPKKSDDDEEEEEDTQKKTAGKSKAKKKAGTDDDEDEESSKPKKKVEEDEDDAPKTRSKPKKAVDEDAPKKSTKPKKTVDEEDAPKKKTSQLFFDDEEEEEKPRKKKEDEEEKPKKKKDKPKKTAAVEEEEEEAKVKKSSKPKKTQDDDDDFPIKKLGKPKPADDDDEELPKAMKKIQIKMSEKSSSGPLQRLPKPDEAKASTDDDFFNAGFEALQKPSSSKTSKAADAEDGWGAFEPAKPTKPAASKPKQTEDDEFFNAGFEALQKSKPVATKPAKTDDGWGAFEPAAKTEEIQPVFHLPVQSVQPVVQQPLVTPPFGAFQQPMFPMQPMAFPSTFQPFPFAQPMAPVASAPFNVFDSSLPPLKQTQTQTQNAQTQNAQTQTQTKPQTQQSATTDAWGSGLVDFSLVDKAPAKKHITPNPTGSQRPGVGR